MKAEVWTELGAPISIQVLLLAVVLGKSRLLWSSVYTIINKEPLPSPVTRQNHLGASTPLPRGLVQ